MPLTLNVGVSKKVGLPDYGSIGATCNVTVELDANLLQTDLETYHRHVRNAYVACAQAVNEELARQQGRTGGNGNGSSAAAASSTPAHHGNGTGNDQHQPANGNGHTGNGRGNNQNGNGNGHTQQPTGSPNHRASQKQLDFASQLSRQIKGLGVRRLEDLASKMFGKPLADLSSLDASSLIDTLKAFKEGRVSLDEILNGAAT